MQINEARIFSFGKLKERTCRFAPGINVIYGPNEAGKTTLHAFLLAMLFGMEKGRGRAAFGAMYQRYEPWHAPSWYSGALLISVDGRPFYLERNFYHREKREILRNMADGEELSVACGDLVMLLGGIGKEAFGNTYDIPQSGAASGKELAGLLAEYLADAAEGGNGSLHVSRALLGLERERKKLNEELRKIKACKAQEQKELEIEQELLERDCISLKAETRRLEQEWAASWKSRESMEQKMNGAQPEKPEIFGDADTGNGSEMPLHRDKRSILYPVLTVLFLAGMLINWGIYHILPYGAGAFAGLECVLGTGAAVFMTLALRRFAVRRHALHKFAQNRYAQHSRDGKTAAQNEAPEALDGTDEPEGMQPEPGRAAHNPAENLKELLCDRETRLYNIRETLAGYALPDDRERGLCEDMDALSLAEDEIRKLSARFCETLEDEIAGEASRVAAAITAGKYDGVKIDAAGRFCVLSDGMELPLEVLSRGTLEQLYLALRIAVGNVITREEPMPLFFDEAFAMYDDARLAQTLKVLAEMDRQMFLFTCQKREMEIMDSLGITYHEVKL